MHVNLHERHITMNPEEAAALIDLLPTKEGMWPRESWPALRLDRGMEVGSKGGHAMIGYHVVEYVPGRRVRFAFSAPRGLQGWHELSISPAGEGVLVRHLLVARLRGMTRLTWFLFIRPLHDALSEDALGVAAGGDAPRWSWWVRLLRRTLALFLRRE